MKEIHAPKVAALKCGFGTTIELANDDWLPKIEYIMN